MKDKLVFEDHLDLNSFATNGRFVTKLKKPFIDLLSKAAFKEEFVADEPDPKPFYLKNWSNREKGIIKNTKIYDRVVNNMKKDIEHYLMQYFDENPVLVPHGVYVTKCTEGYHMTWHHDLGSEAKMMILIYLYDTPHKDKKITTGTVQAGKSRFDQFGNVIDHYDIINVTPQHGDVIFVENTSINFAHNILPFEEGEECVRYLVAFPIGSKSW